MFYKPNSKLNGKTFAIKSTFFVIYKLFILYFETKKQKNRTQS